MDGGLFVRDVSHVFHKEDKSSFVDYKLLLRVRRYTMETGGEALHGFFV